MKVDSLMCEALVLQIIELRNEASTGIGIQWLDGRCTSLGETTKRQTRDVEDAAVVGGLRLPHISVGGLETCG